MPVRLPPLAALRAFEAAARLENFSRAADEIFVTHGAVSHQVRALEDHVGVPLFTRRGRGVALTADGRVLAEAIRAGLAQIADAAETLRRRAHSNRLSITTLPSFGSRWLMPRMVGFMSAHPDWSINIDSTPAIVDFARDGFDVAVRFGTGPWPGMHCEPLMGDEYILVASPSLNRGRLPKKPSALVDHPLLRSEPGPWHAWCRAAGVSLKVPERGVDYEDLGVMLQSAIDGHGILLARRTIAEAELAKGTLVALFGIATPSPESYWIVWPEEPAPSPRTLAFRDWLLAEAAGDRRPSKPPKQSPERSPEPSTKPSTKPRAGGPGGRPDRRDADSAVVAVDRAARRERIARCAGPTGGGSMDEALWKAVLIDVDGTLLDSNDAHARAWVDVLRRHGHDAPFEKVRGLIGKGGDKLLAEVVGFDDETDEGERLSTERRELFAREHLPRCQPTRGARALLEALRARGLLLVVATSAGGDELDGLLKRAGVDDLIEDHATSSDADASKPDPDIVVAALRKSGAAPDEVVMLGDTPYDVESAAKAGVRTIALRCGGWWDDDAFAGAAAIYDDPAALSADLDAAWARVRGAG